MKRFFGLAFVLGLTLSVSLSGCCGRGGSDASDPSGEPAKASSEETKNEEKTSSVPEIDKTPLDVDNPETPEGVVNAFFKTFFSGDDDGAFALLTSRAQAVKRDNFLAQESDSVRWRITKKMKPIRGRVLVYVDVEDYTDSGSIQMDELTFVLTNDDLAWRIAGFSVGELAVNFEDSQDEVYVQDAPAAPAQTAPVKTARTLDDAALVR